MHKPERIISGGQTGADQGALDFALGRGIDCGGWCPRGRICETGEIPRNYPVMEVDSDDYNERTLRNIIDADATLIITGDGRTGDGTRLTLGLVKKYGKPHYHLDLRDLQLPEGEPEHILKWIGQGSFGTLNIAGNRESEAPGIQKKVHEILELLFPA